MVTRKLDFYGLPRNLQDRFIESTRGAAVPTPLAFVPVSDGRPLRAGVVCLLGLVGWFGFTAVGFGALESPRALGGPLDVVIHVIFGFVVSFSALRAYAASWETNRAPYREGAYLFPSGVLVARGRHLFDYDGRALRAVKLDGAKVRVEFDGGSSFLFGFSEASRAEAIRDLFDKGVSKWKSLGEEDTRERARLHALVDSGVPNPLAPTQPHVRQVLFPPAVQLVIAVALGAALGFGVSRGRDSLSEKEIYREAVQANTVEAYRAYLARGGARPDVAEVFLPRAELELAMRAGTVEAIEGFIARGVPPRIAPEAEAVHRNALLVELERAERVGTLAAIEGIRQRFPAHRLIEPELQAARKAAFARAFTAFEAQASPKNADLVPFVRDLLAYTEVHGPTVKVRWAHEFPQSREMLDNIVGKSDKYYLGKKSLPTQYFLGATAQKRETALAEQLLPRLQAAFPEDVVRFEYVGPAQEANLPLPAPEAPTLTLVHRESLSGSFVGGKPKGMYLGATVLLIARLELPGRGKPLEFKWSAWRAPNFSVLVDKDIPEVYEDMMGGAFSAFGRDYLALWFREP